MDKAQHLFYPKVVCLNPTRITNIVGIFPNYIEYRYIYINIYIYIIFLTPDLCVMQMMNTNATKNRKQNYIKQCFHTSKCKCELPQRQNGWNANILNLSYTEQS